MKKRIFPAAILLLFVFLSAVVHAETISFTLKPGAYEILKDSDGYDQITLSGYGTAGSPGNPVLPSRIFNFLVPPDIAWESLELEMVYDVAHNIAKMETHQISGRSVTVCVHRKGATRAFPPGHPEIPEIYQAIGQPVLIPGDMGRASWVLVGAEGSMTQTFGTTCHGAGRALSRKAAMKNTDGRQVERELAGRGIIVRARSPKGLAEEQPLAYKEVDRVVEVVHRAGLSRKVARLRPIGVMKG